MNRIAPLIFTITCLCQLQVSSQSVNTAAAVNIRQFDTTAIADYREKEAYQYGTIEGVSTWEIIKQRIRERLNEWFQHKDGTYSVAVILGVLSILVVAVVLLMNYQQGLMSARNTNRTRELALFDQDVQVDTLPERIAQCESSQDLAGAFRYRFLLLLTELDQDSVIKARRYKTNGDYRREVVNNVAEMAVPFNVLADKFDHVFYGKQSIDFHEYEESQALFEAFRKNSTV